MPETIHEISHEGLEKMQQEVYHLGDIQKITIVVRENEVPVLVVKYKRNFGYLGKGKKIETITVK